MAKYLKLFEDFTSEKNALFTLVLKLAEEKYPAPPRRSISASKKNAGEYKRYFQAHAIADQQQNAFLAAIMWSTYKDIHGVNETSDEEIAKEEYMQNQEKLLKEKKPAQRGKPGNPEIDYDREAASAAFEEGLKWASEKRGKLQGGKYGF
jgi:hypothetical protein